MPRIAAQASYGERGASGREHGKFGGASRCLVIWVSGDRFFVAPAFPFNMIAPLGLLGLEHECLRSQVSAELHRDWAGTNVRLRLATASREAVLDLRVRQPEALIEAVRSPPPAAI